MAGSKARGIDGPCDCTIPPYNKCVVLAPLNAEKLAEKYAKQLGVGFAIVDANDLGVNIFGSSKNALPKEMIAEVIKDNPLGQGHEQTPIGIIRRYNHSFEEEFSI